VTADDKGDISERDRKAKSEFRKVALYQKSSQPITNASVRTITIVQAHNNYNPEREVGNSYTLIVYYGAGVDVNDIQVDVKPESVKWKRDPRPSDYKTEEELRAVIVRIYETVGGSKEIMVTLTPKN
jgi:hypothetical protein